MTHRHAWVFPDPAASRGAHRSPARIRGAWIRGAWVLALAGLGPALAAQERPPSLADLSLEELSNLEITSVSKRPEKLSESAAAVYIITREDIRRAGAESLPEALRLAPNLQVARADASQYAISARGFNSTTANKLLVMIDGRSVYTPLYSGVFWDAQDTLLRDVERIEVVSGPGGTLWGSNAVNGVINIVTRSAEDTQGTFLSAGTGFEERTALAFRHGGRFGEGPAYRVYGTFLERDSTVLATGAPGQDGWRKAQGGFRLDWGGRRDHLTFQGDAYDGTLDQAAYADKTLRGSNLLGRWGHAWSQASELQVQVYYDHTYRDYPGTFRERLDTLDVDVQHRFPLGGRHEIVWGGGYRDSRDDVVNSAFLAFLPAHKQLRLANLFVQDTITLVKDRLHLALGTKLERNSFTGTEAQPNARLAWKVDEGQLLWLAVSRAVRTPSRIDRDFYAPASPPFILAGGPTFTSETLVAYELGYRLQPSPRAALTLTPFYNVYDDLRSIQPTGTGSYLLANGMKGHAYGAECWGDLLLTESWRIRPGFSYLHKHLQAAAGDPNGTSGAGNDPAHQYLLRSTLTLRPQVEIDLTWRRVDPLPVPAVPAYSAVDVHLGWRPSRQLELSLTGQDIFDRRHPEFGSPASRHEIQRSLLLKAVCTF